MRLKEFAGVAATPEHRKESGLSSEQVMELVNGELGQEEPKLTPEEIKLVEETLSRLAEIKDNYRLDKNQENEKAEKEKILLRIGRRVLPLVKERFLGNDTRDTYYFSLYADTLSNKSDIKLLLDSIIHPNIIKNSDRSSLSNMVDSLNRVVYIIRRDNPNDPRLNEIAKAIIPLASEQSSDKKGYLNQVIALTGTKEAEAYMNGCEENSRKEQRKFFEDIENYPKYRLQREGYLGGQNLPRLREEGLIKDEFNEPKSIEITLSGDIYDAPDEDPFYDPYDDPFDNEPLGFKEHNEPRQANILKQTMQLLDALMKEAAQETFITPKSEDNRESSDRYEFFEFEEARKQLFEFTEKIVDYLRKEKISNLVIVDRSSRPLYVGVREYWQKKYPQEKKPNILFVNPNGFKAREDLTEDEIEELINECDFKLDAVETPDQVRPKERIIKEFHEKYKLLVADKEKPVLIFDSCIHSGDTLLPMKKIFKESGFTDLRIGSVGPADRGSSVKDDFHLTTQRPVQGCYPFNRDFMVEKTFSSSASKPTKIEERRARSIRLRKEIKKIMNEYLEMGL